MPMIVLPSVSTNSFGAYDASVPIVRLPLPTIEDGSIFASASSFRDRRRRRRSRGAPSTARHAVLELAEELPPHAARAASSASRRRARRPAETSAELQYMAPLPGPGARPLPSGLRAPGVIS